MANWRVCERCKLRRLARLLLLQKNVQGMARTLRLTKINVKNFFGRLIELDHAAENWRAHWQSGKRIVSHTASFWKINQRTRDAFTIMREPSHCRLCLHSFPKLTVAFTFIPNL